MRLNSLIPTDFRWDLTKDFATEHGISVDGIGFETEMKCNKNEVVLEPPPFFLNEMPLFKILPIFLKTEFVDTNRRKAHQKFGILESGDVTFIVLDKTPSQNLVDKSGDSGTITGANGSLEGADCQKPLRIYPLGKMLGNILHWRNCFRTSTHTVVDKLCDTTSLVIFSWRVQNYWEKTFTYRKPRQRTPNAHRLHVSRAIKPEEIARIEDLVAKPLPPQYQPIPGK